MEPAGAQPTRKEEPGPRWQSSLPRVCCPSELAWAVAVRGPEPCGWAAGGFLCMPQLSLPPPRRARVPARRPRPTAATPGPTRDGRGERVLLLCGSNAESLDRLLPAVGTGRSPRKRTTSQCKSEPPLLRTSKRTIYTAGRPPWYNEHGTQSKEAFAIGEQGPRREGRSGRTCR